MKKITDFRLIEKKEWDKSTFLLLQSDEPLEEIKAAIQKRDEMDKNKKEGSLKIAEDATYIDTSDLTIEQVCEIILSKIHI